MFVSLHTSAFTIGKVGSASRNGGFYARLRQAYALRSQRLHLASLDDRTLEDIGLTRSQALSEASRPVWDVPAHWKN